MKQFGISLLVIVGAILLSGCTSSQTPSIDNNSGLNQQLSGLQDQISGVNAQIQQLSTKNDELSKENETLKATLKTNSGNSNNSTPTIKTVTTTPIKATDSRYRKIYSNQYSVFSSISNSNKEKDYKICPVGKDNCVYLVQYNGSFKTYITSFDEIGLKDVSTKGESNLVGKKTWTCGHRISEREMCFVENKYGSLIMSVENGKGDIDYNPKDILKLIDF